MCHRSSPTPQLCREASLEWRPGLRAIMLNPGIVFFWFFLLLYSLIKCIWNVTWHQSDKCVVYCLVLWANLQAGIMLLPFLCYWSFQSEMMRVLLENQTQQCLFLLLSYHLFTAPNHKMMPLQFLAFEKPLCDCSLLKIKKERGRRQLQDCTLCKTLGTNVDPEKGPRDLKCCKIIWLLIFSSRQIRCK